MPDPKPELNEAPKRRRYGWWIFLALILLLAAICLPYWVQAQKQIALIERIEAAGGMVKTEPVGPEWLRSILGEERMRGFDDVTSIGFKRTIDELLLEEIGTLTSLKVLGFSDTQVTDNGLKHLQGLTNLEFLALDNTQVTGAGLANLKGLSKLITLTLMHTDVTDTGLSHLKGLTSLRRLHLNDTQISDAGLTDLKGMPNLIFLWLHDTKITDTGIVHLKGLASLKNLTLDNTQVTQAGVKELRDALPDCQINWSEN